MGKERQPTPEERRLWREVTRHDVKYKPEPQEAEAPATATTQTHIAPAPAAATPLRRSSPRAALELLDARAAARLFRPHARPEATLDLHGLGKLDAYEQVQRFIMRAQLAGFRHILIITGKGRSGEGVLRTNLPHWLNEPALRAAMSGVAHAHPNKGGSGVFHILLKRR
jgi:DNA-nicking Smr family endonuclease